MDNNIGYVLSNVIPCCKNCNLSKSNRTPYDFLSWVFKLYNNVKKKGGATWEYKISYKK